MSGPRIRILYVIDELHIGGTEQQLLELLTGLDRARYEPQVACFRDRGRIASEIEALGVPVTLIEKRAPIDPVFFWRLLRFIRSTRPDIVQTHLFTANTWGRLAAWLGRVPPQHTAAGLRNGCRVPISRRRGTRNVTPRTRVARLRPPAADRGRAGETISTRYLG